MMSGKSTRKETVSAVNDQAEKTFDVAVTAIKTGIESAAAETSSKSQKVANQMEKAMKTAEELAAFGQGNIEAFVKSGQIWAAGIQDLSKQVAAQAQAQLDETMSMFKAFSSIKSLKEMVELQNSMARSSVEKAVAQTSHFTDATIKLAEQTIAPLTARMTVAVEKFSATV
jgi:phasin family protein